MISSPALEREVLSSLVEVYNALAPSEGYPKHYFVGQLQRYYVTLRLIRLTITDVRSSVLDIGAYPGHIQKALLLMGYNVQGVDLDPERYSAAFDDCRRRTVPWDIESEDYAGPENNNAAFLFEVLEHLHVNPLNLFRQLPRIVRVGGTLLLSTPNLFAGARRWHYLMGQQVFEHPFSVYEKLENLGHRGHQRLYSLQEITDFVETFGFTVVRKLQIDHSPPFASADDLRETYGGDFPPFLAALARPSRRLRHRGRAWLTSAFSTRFPALAAVNYVVARRDGEFDPDRFLAAMHRADPWRRVDADSKALVTLANSGNRAKM